MTDYFVRSSYFFKLWFYFVKSATFYFSSRIYLSLDLSASADVEDFLAELSYIFEGSLGIDIEESEVPIALCDA